jgi:serine/threonine-protein kinase
MATCPTCRTRYPDDVKTCSADGEALLPDEAMAAADADLAVGQTVGEYKVEGKLGEGGFGAVYRAVHPLIGKAAAIKVLNKQYSANPQMVSRFIAEARAVNQIRNRNIIDIFSFGALEDGRQYYVMELLDGTTLDGYLKQKGRLSPEEAMPIFRGIARALDAAHAAGIAHRDLKPENVFLVFEDDGTVFPKLLDFGIAKLLGDSIAGHKTRTGTPMGTPHYMSPEQCRGRNVDHRTDVYSFGVLAFETLTGKVPFDGEDVMEILIKHTSQPAPRPSEVCAALPAGMDAPLLAFLEKEPDKRPTSIGAGLDALAQAAADAGFDVKVSARKPGDPARTSGPQARVGGATPGEIAALAEARTMLPDEGGKTVLSVEAAAKPAGGRTMIYGVAAAVGVVAVVSAALLMRGKDGPVTAATAQPTAVPATTATATVAAQKPAEPVPTVTPSAMPAALPAEVEVTFETTPKQPVEIWQGTTKLGTSAAPLKLKRGDDKVKLTVKAAGFAPQDVEVTPSESQKVAVTLKKAAAGGGSKKHGDLEF